MLLAVMQNKFDICITSTIMANRCDSHEKSNVEKTRARLVQGGGSVNE